MRRAIARRGTGADKDVVETLAPLRRKPCKPSPSKADLREQANEAWINWQSRQLTSSGSSVPVLTSRSSG